MNFSIDELNGGTILAMRGADSVCIASDLRLGEQMLTIVENKPKVYKMGDRLYLGLAGLATDTQTVYEKLQLRKNIFELKESRKVRPQTLTRMLANLLYERRFGPYFISPIVAGLDPVTFKPYISGTDLIGCIGEPDDFVTGGMGSTTAMGLCETVWEPNMDQDALFEATAQAMLGCLERDAGSGWGAIVYTICKDKVIIKSLKGRMD